MGHSDIGTLVPPLTASLLAGLPVHEIHRLIRERSVRTVDVRGLMYVVLEDVDLAMQKGRPA
jgi:hypothetical protein